MNSNSELYFTSKALAGPCLLFILYNFIYSNQTFLPNWRAIAKKPRNKRSEGRRGTQSFFVEPIGPAREIFSSDVRVG